MTGIPLPYYSIQVIYWVILIDQWDGSVIVSTTLNQKNNSQINATYNSVHYTTKNLCGSNSKN